MNIKIELTPEEVEKIIAMDVLKHMSISGAMYDISVAVSSYGATTVTFTEKQAQRAEAEAA